MGDWDRLFRDLDIDEDVHVVSACVRFLFLVICEFHLYTKQQRNNEHVTLSRLDSVFKGLEILMRGGVCGAP